MDELTQLGFVPDLGPSMGLTLPDGSTLLVAGLGDDGEPTAPIDLDAPGLAQLLTDPWDHDTLVRETTQPTLRAVITEIRQWIANATPVA
jgi:hypothetical protein